LEDEFAIRKMTNDFIDRPFAWGRSSHDLFGSEPVCQFADPIHGGSQNEEWFLIA
jgi:hypothetical protein